MQKEKNKWPRSPTSYKGRVHIAFPLISAIQTYSSEPVTLGFLSRLLQENFVCKTRLIWLIFFLPDLRQDAVCISPHFFEMLQMLASSRIRMYFVEGNSRLDKSQTGWSDYPGSNMGLQVGVQPWQHNEFTGRETGQNRGAEQSLSGHMIPSRQSVRQRI